MDWQYTLNNDPDYHRWLEMIDLQKCKSCFDCRYSIRKARLDPYSAMFCFNPNCSHTGEHWTSCSDSRHIDHGLCGPDAKYFKDKADK